jgi:hypothetical protein
MKTLMVAVNAKCVYEEARDHDAQHDASLVWSIRIPTPGLSYYHSYGGPTSSSPSSSGSIAVMSTYFNGAHDIVIINPVYEYESALLAGHNIRTIVHGTSQRAPEQPNNAIEAKTTPGNNASLCIQFPKLPPSVIPALDERAKASPMAHYGMNERWWSMLHDGRIISHMHHMIQTIYKPHH